MPLLRHLDAFYETHRRCGGLDDAVDGGRIWTTCSCGAVVGRTPGQRIVYLEIPEFPGYMIGSDGSVWSRRRASEWRRLRPGRSKSHYVAGGLRKWTGKKTAVHVHRLVLEAFVGPPPEGAVACHNNGNGYDNRVANLRWDTRKANAADTVRHGVHPRQLARLSEGQLSAYPEGVSIAEIARLHGATPLAVRRVLDRGT